MTRSSTAWLCLGLFAGACATTPPAPTAPSTAPTPAAAVAAPPDEPWRATAPAPQPAPPLTTPKFEKAVLKNGLTVLVSERHELPIVAIDVAFAAGSSADPKGRGGLASLTYHLLLQGAGGKDAIALDDAFAELGATPDVAVSQDGAVVGMQILKRNADPALALLADVVQRPRLLPEDFVRKQKETLADLALQSSNPKFLSREALVAVVFGEEHPYGHLASGNLQTVAALKAADVRSFYSQRLGPKNGALVVTGDVTLAEAVAWGEKHFGAWKSATRPVAPVPDPKAPTARTQLLLVPKEGLNQTVIALGRPAVKAGSPEEIPLQIAGTIAGGFFGSRLNMNLRERKGYSYGVFSSLDARRGTGVLLAGGAMRADVTGVALTELVNELKGLKQTPITEAEFLAAREGLIRAIPGTFDSVADLSTAAANLFYKELPLDRFAQVARALEQTDRATVQASAEKYFDPALMQVVLVGDPATVRSQVEPLGLGPLKERPAPKSPAPKPAAPAKSAKTG